MVKALLYMFTYKLLENICGQQYIIILLLFLKNPRRYLDQGLQSASMVVSYQKEIMDFAVCKGLQHI